MIGTCPLDEVLELLLTEPPSESGQQAVNAHIADCPECQRRLEELRRAWIVDLQSNPIATDFSLLEDSTPMNAGLAATRLFSPSVSDVLDTETPPVGAHETIRPDAQSYGVSPETPLPSRGSNLPSSFGRYQVSRPLGAGGFGTVYLGHDTELDRPVAIKVLNSGLSAVGEDSLQEARRLAKLRHPGIVTVHDVGMQDGQVYIVSDYLEGLDLGRWLRENRPHWMEAAAITAAVADALAHAHAKLIVHRDVKPANILLTADRVPVLVDFGLALDEVGAGGGQMGLVAGTPWYMSPEQAAGNAHRIDGRTDIYSLGVVLYEMLTGRVPFQSADYLEVFRKVRDDEPQPPRQLVREIPPDLERSCLKAMAKRQQDRFTTAGDFADNLRRILAAASGTSISRPMTQEMGAEASRTITPSTLRPSAVIPPSSRSRALESERRQVTILVCGCELFESEAYLGLETEDQAHVLRVFQQACDRAIRHFNGTIVQCTEQGLLACFGYPVAYEDAARRSARAGLMLLDEVKSLAGSLRLTHNLEATAWVGLHTGPAIVEAKEDVVSLVGDARNVAVRLKEAATPGHVICTEATHRLFKGRFQCADLGHRKVKGVAQPVRLFRVEKIAVAGSLLEAAPAELSPLIGRDHEISLLKDRWEQAQEGMGQVVLLVGEPGLGKSRLVHTLKAHVLGQMVEGEVDAPVIEWRCSPHYQNTGLHPAIDFHERALGFRPEEPPQDRFDRLLRRVEQYGLARPEVVPLWASLLSLPTPERFPPLSLSPARHREETFRLMLEWLHVRASRGPILFVVEDLHWVDASTLEFLGLILAEFLHDQILILLTFRPEFKPPWTSVDHQTTLSLNRLTKRQVGDLMRKQAKGTLTDAAIEQVYDRAGGVPLFVEEFTKMVQELTATGPALLGHEIPSTLQDLVMARLDRMEGGRELAQLAAVLGREFSHELLATVATVDEPTLQAELAKLSHAEILYAKGRPPRCTYIFKHALLEDALYNALVKGKRQHFHRQIGDVLEAKFPQTAETEPELLGHHFTEAGLTEKAIGYWLKAAQRSRERSALSEAIGHLARGRALLETLAESRERDVLELQLLTALGPTYIAARGYAAPEVGPVLVRARELCQRIGDQKLQFGIMLGMWEWHIVRGDLRVCVDQAADGMALAESANDSGMLMEALFMPGVTMFYRGEFAGARACFDKALSNYDDAERTKFWTVYTGHNASVTHRCYLALALWQLGYPDQALQTAREMQELARTIGHAFTLGHALDFAAVLYHNCRLGAEAQAAGEEEIALGAEQGFPLWQALGTLHKGAGLYLQGRCDDALPLLLKGVSAFRATGAGIRIPRYLGVLADAYTQLGQFEDARKALEEGLAVAEKNDDRTHEAELVRLNGELLLAESTDQTADAEVCFRQAIEIARRQQSRAWELRATMSLGRLLQRQGRTEEARSALASVYGTYTEGFSTPDLVEARALLAPTAGDFGG
ncbi:MAG TPA: protein kinase [Gemmataceae bacterium]|nr:protein kinase [Gemmataceae bacterium]